MWIISPDVAFNTDGMQAFWAMGRDDRCLHLRFPERDERIEFLHPASAVKAFDAVVKGLAEGRTSVLLREYRAGKYGNPVLKAEYDCNDYETPIKAVYNEWVECDDPHLMKHGMIKIVKKEA